MDLPAYWQNQNMTCDFSRRPSGTTGNDGKVKKWPESQGQPAGLRSYTRTGGSPGGLGG